MQSNVMESMAQLYKNTLFIYALLGALHTGAGGVRAGPHCGKHMRENVHTGAGLGAESWEHFFGFFIWFLSSTMTKWAMDSWPSQDKAFTSNLMHAPLSLCISNFQILQASQ